MIAAMKQVALSMKPERPGALTVQLSPRLLCTRRRCLGVMYFVASWKMEDLMHRIIPAVSGSPGGDNGGGSLRFGRGRHDLLGQHAQPYSGSGSPGSSPAD